MQVLEGVEHRIEVAAGQLPVEALGEGLEVDIGRIDVAVEFGPRFRAVVTGGDRHRAYTQCVAGLGHVDGVLGEDHGVVVGVGDTLATQPDGSLCDRFRARTLAENGSLTRL